MVIYILYNNFVNNQYLHLKLNDYAAFCNLLKIYSITYRLSVLTVNNRMQATFVKVLFHRF